MSNQVIFIIMGVSVALMVVIGIAYYIMNKKMQKSDYKKIQNLQRGTKASAFSSEIMYQKLYIFFSRVPFIKRYVLKLRRRLEILNIDDEYATRRDSAKIITKARNNDYLKRILKKLEKNCSIILRREKKLKVPIVLKKLLYLLNYGVGL